MKIGQVSKKTGITVEAIRFYEKEGLIDTPPRTSSGYRDYSTDQLQIISFIRKAKELGFSLKEIKEIMELRYTPGTTCGDIKRKAEEKVAIITERIDLLLRVKNSLNTLIESCTEESPVATCPIIELLSHENQRIDRRSHG